MALYSGVRLLIGLTAVMLSACGSPAANTNANADAAKPVATKPDATPATVDAMYALEERANAAYVKGETNFFEDRLTDKFILAEGGQRLDRAAAIKMIGGVKCDVKHGNLDEPHLARIDADTYAFSYRAIWDGTCTGPDGKPMRMPSPVRGATIWIRNGNKWLAAFHGENLIVDPKAPAAPPATPDAATAAASAPAGGDANTELLVKAELAIWEAWAAKDQKKLEDLTADEISFVNIFGTYLATKADAIKDWTGNGCDAKSVSVTGGAATALSPNVELLTVKATADGTCGGQKIVGAVYGTTVYVKDGDRWKWAFGMNMPGAGM
jgi:hypothetical protein